MWSRTFTHPDTGCTVEIADDGRGAWAFLRDPAGDIIGDVWLYNRVAPPQQLDLTRSELAPFLNPLSLARPLEGPLPSRAQLDVRWTMTDEVLLADVLVREALLARLSPGTQPGWNTLAVCDGPLALVLT